MPNANVLEHKHDLEGFTVSTKTATILSGASQSGAIDLEGYQLVGLNMPAAWTAAAITYLASPTLDGTYLPVYESGIEVTDPAAANQYVAIAANAVALASIRFLKLRSGTLALPVAQGADRTITLSLKR